MIASRTHYANSAASLVLVLGIQWAGSEKWSTMITIQLFSFKDIGMAELKSAPTVGGCPLTAMMVLARVL